MIVREGGSQSRIRSRRAGVAFWSIALISLGGALSSCDEDDPRSDESETGGEPSSGGDAASDGGSDVGDGGGPDAGGASLGGEGGEPASGGVSSGGTSSGGKNTGGVSSGGWHSGGSSSGGKNTGGTGAGGASGGSASGGSHSGGSGGISTGGAPSGGASSGGSSGSGGNGGNVQVTDNVLRAGVSCVRVRTPVAEYFYDKAGAGLVSMLDGSGRDWISWQPGGGPDGEFRGVPNMGSCCHPGYTGATTSIVSQTAQRAEVRSTGSGWELRWEFLPDRVRLTVVDAPATYYLLYEGTPGGSVGPEDYLGRPGGVLAPLQTTEIYADFANPEWVYFLDDALGRALVVKHGQDDAVADTYWTYESMTVLGFGRTCKGGCTGMTASGQTLVLAFSDDTDPVAMSSFADALY